MNSEKKTEKTRLYDFTAKDFIIFAVVYFILFCFAVFTCVNYLELTSFIFLAFVAASFVFIVYKFGINAVVLSSEGIRQGKKFILKENILWKEEYDARYRENRIIFKDKTVFYARLLKKEQKKFIISIQNKKGYAEKIKKFYNT